MIDHHIDITRKAKKAEKHPYTSKFHVTMDALIREHLTFFQTRIYGYTGFGVVKGLSVLYSLSKVPIVSFRAI